ncbi:hypothetical protein Hanom_Chr06g00553501 [Helianthus anomalus]
MNDVHDQSYFAQTYFWQHWPLRCSFQPSKFHLVYLVPFLLYGFHSPNLLLEPNITQNTYK